MTTPRKYPTLAEFKELKEAVARIEASLAAKPARASVLIDSGETCERIGLVDAYDVPVAVGDWITPLDGGRAEEVREISLRCSAVAGKATLHAITATGKTVTAVDMRLPSHAVTKKATA